MRHLILPGFIDSTRLVLQWFAEHARGRALLSLMTQYTPIKPHNGAPDRFLREDEYETVIGWLGEFGIEDGFCQEPAAGGGRLPDFSRVNPFSPELFVPVRHFTGL